MTPEEMAWKAVERLYRENDEGLRALADIERRERTYFPDWYDEWSLMSGTSTLFEGTEDACRQFAYENYSDGERLGLQLYLMDWEGREWDV